MNNQPAIFTFQLLCEEIPTPKTFNYALIEDNNQRRTQCFGNVQIDKQIILASDYQEEHLDRILNGNDDLYANCSIYFFPTKYESQIDTLLNHIKTTWKNGTFKGGYEIQGEIYLVTSKSDNGTFLMTYDGSFGPFECEHLIFQECNIDVSDNISNEEICVVYNYNEAAAADFFTFLSREYKDMLQLTVTEGLFDSECIFNEEVA